MMQPKPQSNKLISPEEKQALLTRLTSTMHDLGRLPGLIFAPVIAFVSTHYAKIPTERKGHLQKILDEIKAGSGEGVEKLKVRLKDMVEAAKKKAKEKAKEARQGGSTQKAPAKKTSPKKPTKRVSSSKTKKTTSTIKKPAGRTRKTTK